MLCKEIHNRPHVQGSAGSITDMESSYWGDCNDIIEKLQVGKENGRCVVQVVDQKG